MNEMEKLRVHGKLLDEYIKEKKNPSILLELKEKYELWAKEDDTEELKNKFIEYVKFFDKKSNEIRKAIGSERKFATLIGYRLEEFVYLLFFKYCREKKLTIKKIPPGKIIAWIGFDNEGNLQIFGHGADLAIGNWKKLSLGMGIKEEEYFIPKVIIECKHYVSLDMFRDIVTEADMFKRVHPYSIFIVVCEIIEMTEEFKKIKKVWEANIDGFFVFRSGNRRNPGEFRKKDIDAFEKFVKNYLENL